MKKMCTWKLCLVFKACGKIYGDERVRKETKWKIKRKKNVQIEVDKSNEKGAIQAIYHKSEGISCSWKRLCYAFCTFHKIFVNRISFEIVYSKHQICVHDTVLRSSDTFPHFYSILNILINYDKESICYWNGQNKK